MDYLATNFCARNACKGVFNPNRYVHEELHLHYLKLKNLGVSIFIIEELLDVGVHARIKLDLDLV